MKFKLATCITALFSAVSLSFGQSRPMPILEVNPDARAAAMGGNQYGESRSMQLYSNSTSILYNEDDTQWNASAATQVYPSVEESGRLMYYGASLSRAFENHAIHGGFRYLGGYSVPLEDGGAPLKPFQYTVDLGYSIRLSDHFSASLTASYLNSKVSEQASTFAASVSAYYRNYIYLDGIEADYIIGMGAANMGHYLDYGDGFSKENLPAMAGGGGEVSLNFNEKNRVNLSAAAQYYYLPKKARMKTANLGAEYTYDGMVSIRAGYKRASRYYNTLSFGAGVAYSIFRLDLSHLRGAGENDVNLTLVSLGVRF